MTEAVERGDTRGSRTIEFDRAGFRDRIGNALAIFRAIDLGELLSAGPECDIEAGLHSTALRLLALAESELTALYLELASSSDATAD